MNHFDPELYWNSRITGAIDLAEVGQNSLGAYNKIAYRFRLKAIKDALSYISLDFPNIRLFEAGFGTGFYLSLWDSMEVDNVIGVDISFNAVSLISKVFPQYYIFQHDIAKTLPTDFKKVDLALAIDVLYHIIDDTKWEKSIENLAKLVRPGGFLIFTDKFPSDGVYQKEAHVRRRSLELYRNILIQQGFRIERIQPVFILMDNPIVFGSPKWLGMVSLLQWKLLMLPFRVFKNWTKVRDIFAIIIAYIQYPVEQLALAVFDRSPNLEMVIAKKEG
ncbi:MAG: methyltransferase domain-containing protein [Chloroflexota bacterium]|nr:methyltransferase domain-containing protein [Chloroflexota bacterium]